jgi:hypothetical protein
MKRIDKFTKKEIEQAFRESKSLDAVARKLGYLDIKTTAVELTRL